MDNYQRCYHRYYYYKRKCEKLESEIERLKSIEELARAYKSMAWMLLRYFSQATVSDERIAKYREALKVIQTKDESSSDLIPILSRVLGELEKKLKTSKPIQR
jgi:hypothetical protein